MYKVIYCGIFFDNIPTNIKADFPNTPKYYHITDTFRPAEKELKASLLGKKIKVEILGIGNNKRNQALLTKDNFLGYRHITVSWINGSTPKESKNINNWTMFEKPIVIYGTYGYFTGKGILTEKIPKEK